MLAKIKGALRAPRHSCIIYDDSAGRRHSISRTAAASLHILRFTYTRGRRAATGAARHARRHRATKADRLARDAETRHEATDDGLPLTQQPPPSYFLIFIHHVLTGCAEYAFHDTTAAASERSS